MFLNETGVKLSGEYRRLNLLFKRDDNIIELLFTLIYKSRILFRVFCIYGILPAYLFGREGIKCLEIN